MLEDIGNEGNMMNMITVGMAAEDWPELVTRNSHVHQLTCDSHQQTPSSPTYWNTDMTNQQSNMMTNNMMNVNMMNGNMMTNTSGNMMNSNMMNVTMMTDNGNMMTNNSG